MSAAPRFIVRLTRADGIKVRVPFQRYAAAWTFYMRVLTFDPNASLRT